MTKQLDLQISELNEIQQRWQIPLWQCLLIQTLR